MLDLFLTRKEGEVKKMNTMLARTSGIVPLLIELQFVEIRWRVKACKYLEE